MTPQQYQRVKQLFAESAGLPAGAQGRWLDQHCGDDPQVRQALEGMLAHEGTPHGLLGSGAQGLGERVASALEAANVRARRSSPGSALRPLRVGRYTILETLGEGGMGVVYLAEQQQPRRQVALKLIRPGIASRHLLRRFEHEADILAQLQHPGIAQVYEAGVAEVVYGPAQTPAADAPPPTRDAGDLRTRTHSDAHVAPAAASPPVEPGDPNRKHIAVGDPQPFFAMEYVRGEPLHDYAKRRQLDLRSRLELIANICDAVQHAHMKGVIHRDLKPGNILVAEQPSAIPKILDFGVARMTDSDVQSVTLQTDVGQLVGTIPYMSPEQIAGDSSRLDTRSDVYALGVITYQLLAGRLPLDVSARSLAEAARMVREEEPPRLSSAAGLGVPCRSFRGDIDTIVGKALEKDRERRYGSAAELAADLRRYLRDEPIIARPPSRGYQFRKFAKRNKALVGGVAGVVLALAIGTIVSVWFAFGQARARKAAQAQATIAEATTNFLIEDILGAVDPSRSLGRDMSVREALDRAVEKLEAGALADQPVVEAAVRSAIGDTYISLSAYDQAERHLTRCLDLRRASLGERHADTLVAMNSLGILYLNWNRYEQAEPLLVRAAALRREVLGTQDRFTLGSMNNLANLYYARGKYAEAEPIYRELTELGPKLLGEDDRYTLNFIANLARLLQRLDRYDEAEPLGRRVLEIRTRVLGERHPDTLVSMNNLAVMYRAWGKLDQAEPLQARVLELRREVLGPEHGDTISTQHNLAGLYADQGRYSEAEPLLLEVIEVRERTLGPDHERTLNSRYALAELYVDQQRCPDAEPLLVRVADGRRRLLGEQHLSTLETMHRLAQCQMARQDYAAAEPLLRHCDAALERMNTAPTRLHRSVLELLITVLEQGNRQDDVLPFRERLTRMDPAQ